MHASSSVASSSSTPAGSSVPPLLPLVGRPDRGRRSPYDADNVRAARGKRIRRARGLRGGGSFAGQGGGPFRRAGCGYHLDASVCRRRRCFRSRCMRHGGQSPYVPEASTPRRSRGYRRLGCLPRASRAPPGVRTGRRPHGVLVASSSVLIAQSGLSLQFKNESVFKKQTLLLGRRPPTVVCSPASGSRRREDSPSRSAITYDIWPPLT